MNDPWIMAFVAGVILIAGFVRGFTGFGGPLIMIAGLAFLLPPTQLVPSVIIVDLTVNLGLLPGATRECRRDAVKWSVLGMIPTVPIGIYALAHGEADTLRMVVHVIVLCAACLLLSGWNFGRPLRNGEFFAAGSLNGAISGASGIAAGMIPFFFAGPEPASQGRANFIIWGFCLVIMMLGLLWFQEKLSLDVFTWAAMGAPFYILGGLIGARLYGRVPDAGFRRIVLLVLAAVSLYGLVK